MLAGYFMVRFASAAPTSSSSPSAPAVVYTTTTPTPCPVATPELLAVQPVTSPTRAQSQTITVHLGNGEAVTVLTASGAFSTTGSFGAFSSPALVNVALISNTTHNLLVEGRVRVVNQGGCQYGGYTLTTRSDRTGKPLVIVQVSDRAYYPVFINDPTPTSAR